MEWLPKFRILPKVDGFTKDGVQYKPGDIVDLPKRYATFNWLEPVEPEPKVKAPPTKVEPPIEEKPVPLEVPKKKKRK